MTLEDPDCPHLPPTSGYMTTDAHTGTAGHWPRAIIFDLDGTLIDSIPDITAAANHALNPYNVTINTKQTRQYIGHGTRQLTEKAANAHNLALDHAALDQLTADLDAYYREHPCENSTIYPGVSDMLAHHHESGTALAVCTNKVQEVADEALACLGLEPWFNTIIGAGTYAPKPNPEPLLACLERLSVQPQDALYIGDMDVDRQTAQAAEVKSLLVEFGYSPTPVSTLGADGTLAHWQDLDKAISRLQHISR